jgi:hypothetical protein
MALLGATVAVVAPFATGTAAARAARTAAARPSAPRERRTADCRASEHRVQRTFAAPRGFRVAGESVQARSRAGVCFREALVGDPRRPLRRCDRDCRRSGGPHGARPRKAAPCAALHGTTDGRVRGKRHGLGDRSADMPCSPGSARETGRAPGRRGQSDSVAAEITRGTRATARLSGRRLGRFSTRGAFSVHLT